MFYIHLEFRLDPSNFQNLFQLLEGDAIVFKLRVGIRMCAFVFFLQSVFVADLCNWLALMYFCVYWRKK